MSTNHEISPALDRELSDLAHNFNEQIQALGNRHGLKLITKVDILFEDNSATQSD